MKWQIGLFVQPLLPTASARESRRKALQSKRHTCGEQSRERPRLKVGGRKLFKPTQESLQQHPSVGKSIGGAASLTHPKFKQRKITDGSLTITRSHVSGHKSCLFAKRGCFVVSSSNKLKAELWLSELLLVASLCRTGSFLMLHSCCQG